VHDSEGRFRQNVRSLPPCSLPRPHDMTGRVYGNSRPPSCLAVEGAWLPWAVQDRDHFRPCPATPSDRVVCRAVCVSCVVSCCVKFIHCTISAQIWPSTMDRSLVAAAATGRM
jgi:hypothetical protein